MSLLFVTSVVSFLSVHSSSFARPLLQVCNKQTYREKDLLRQKQMLEVEQSQISMVDEFASYSKIQRRINVIEQQLSEIRSERSYNVLQLNFVFTYGMKVAFILILMWISIYYRNVPVFKLSQRFDLSPFTRIISYPNTDNSVSVHFWVMCCTAVAKLIKI